jgi:hypothetical protein
VLRSLQFSPHLFHSEWGGRAVALRHLSRLLHEVVHHLNFPLLASSKKALFSLVSTYTIAAATHLLAPHAFLQPARPPSDQAVPLQRLVVLYMLRELAERIPRSGALCASKERHRGSLRFSGRT